MAFLDPILDPVLKPLLNMSPFFGILVIALFISVIMSLTYKWLTDQEKMKALKDKQKEFQNKTKELKDQPEKLISLQKEAMKTNMDYMKQSFKPTLVTMIPILLIFAWMSGNLAYEPIYPGESFSITANFAEGIVGDAELIVDNETILGEATAAMQEIDDGQVMWMMESEDGEHILEVKLGEESQLKKVLITTELEYEDSIELFTHSDIESIQINYNKLKPLGTTSILGWQPGWLGIYILFSLVFSLSIRKLMGLY
ncbi:TMCO1/EMC3 family protein [archaeon]|jgi:uncharacterized membrane protein (DUF106 family)|nr:TMCO1/EMC3 family protein [archaeon]MBT3450701.1 TMCO1/EMC3 family protein [archaeon]MBT6869193.1 TMCO1/EMC3 family protein [archaeon]MBT7193729.1 TMCO1/EMC3 family protein [archaeon]MBT7381376.1 TMCO1/EMC3 family protein [archaeon]